MDNCQNHSGCIGNLFGILVFRTGRTSASHINTDEKSKQAPSRSQEYRQDRRQERSAFQVEG
eukprot:4160089-Pleurochrysis_carterae.AAC.1